MTQRMVFKEGKDMLKSDYIHEIRYAVKWLNKNGGEVEVLEMMRRHRLLNLRSLDNRTKAELAMIYNELDNAMTWYQ